MAHFAIIRKSDNIVIAVTTVNNSKMGNPETEQAGIDHLINVFTFGCPYGDINDLYFKQCSYNASSLKEKRYNYPGIGHTYDSTNDVFIAPDPTSEDVTYTLDNTFKWVEQEVKKSIFTRVVNWFKSLFN